MILRSLYGAAEKNLSRYRHQQLYSRYIAEWPPDLVNCHQIDCKLNFNKHVNNVLNKVSRVSGMIWRGRSILSQKIRKMLYLSLAWPQLTYGILSWGRCGLGGIGKIIKAQNKIVKLIFGSSVQSTYISNSIFQFQKAYDYFAAIKLYREINNQSVTYFSNRIDSFQVNHSHNTRFSSAGNFVPPLFSRSKCFSSFLHGSIHVWNDLPTDIKNVNSLFVFKSKLRQHFLSWVQDILYYCIEK